MQDFQEVIYTDLNNEIIYDEIYDVNPVNDMTECARGITAENYHKYGLEKLADACTNIDK